MSVRLSIKGKRSMNTSIKNAGRWTISWDALRNLLMILTSIAILFFAFQMLTLVLTYILPFQSVEALAVSIPKITASSLESLEGFQKKMEVRNLFFAPKKPEETPKAAGIEEKLQDLSLIGVVTSDEPEAIVKDNRSDQTYFVRGGQKIRDIEVKEVKSGSVILKAGDEEREIFLD